MQFRDVMNLLDVGAKEDLAEDLGTTVKYLRKLAGGFCMPSLKMATAIQDRYPEVTNREFIDAYDAYVARRASHKRKRKPLTPSK